MRNINILVSMILLCLWSVNSFADSCTTIYNQTSTAGGGAYSVDYSSSVGSVIATIHAPGTPKYADGCGEGQITFGLSMRYGMKQLSSYENHVYNTNVSGVGIRLYNNSGGASGLTFDSPRSTVNNTKGATYGWDGGTIQLIKTGRINSGVVNSGSLGMVEILGFDGAYHDAVAININAITINASGCGVTTPSVNVPLGEYLTTQFSNTGSTTDSKPVIIKLDCNQGTKVNATLFANADTSQAGTIKLTSGTGTASGVGVQLLDSNNSPLPINSLFTLGTTMIDGEYDINWQARYIKTSSTITPGQANAIATLALTYE